MDRDESDGSRLPLTSLLDVLGLLLVAAGVYFAAERVMGPAALMCAGAVVLIGSALASREPAEVPAWRRVAEWIGTRLAARRGSEDAP